MSIDGAYVVRFSVNGTQPTQLDVGYFGKHLFIKPLYVTTKPF